MRTEDYGRDYRESKRRSYAFLKNPVTYMVGYLVMWVLVFGYSYSTNTCVNEAVSRFGIFDPCHGRGIEAFAWGFAWPLFVSKEFFTIVF